MEQETKSGRISARVRVPPIRVSGLDDAALLRSSNGRCETQAQGGMGVKRWLSARTQAAASAIAIAVGVLFAILPQDWIEERFGIDPDAGNGSIERLLVGVPLAIGAALAVSAIVSFLRRQSQRSSAS